MPTTVPMAYGAIWPYPQTLTELAGSSYCRSAYGLSALPVIVAFLQQTDDCLDLFQAVALFQCILLRQELLRESGDKLLRGSAIPRLCASNRTDQNVPGDITYFPSNADQA
jgi:hypothetical protein